MKNLTLTLLLAAAPAAAERRIVTCKPEATMERCRAQAEALGRVVHVLTLARAVAIETSGARLVRAALPGEPRAIDRIEADRRVRWIASAQDASWDRSGDAASLVEDARDLRDAVADRPAPAAGACRAEAAWSVLRMGAPRAWTRTSGAGVSVAVLDTGVDASHPLLRGKVAGGVNLVTPLPGEPASADWSDDTPEGHGTRAAGLIAASGGSEDFTGVAPAASVYAVKVIDRDGYASYSDVIAGLQWAVDRRMKVVNMSLAAVEGTETFRAAVRAATAAGTVIVAATGNGWEGVGYPAAYEEVIAVAGSDREDRPMELGNRGPQVDFVAPGLDVVAPTRGGTCDSEVFGTSIAAPHVAAAAVLAISRGADSPAAVRAALTRAARPVIGDHDSEGAGMIDVGALVGAPVLVAQASY